MFHDFERRFADYQDRLRGFEAPLSRADRLSFDEREAIRREARRQQAQEIARRFGGFWRGLFGRR